MGRGIPGRIQCRLVELLEAEGFIDVKLSPAEGYWRSSPFADTYRWEGRCREGVLLRCIYSWDTMTQCVKMGIRIERDEKDLLVWAKDSATKHGVEVQ